MGIWSKQFVAIALTALSLVACSQNESKPADIVGPRRERVDGCMHDMGETDGPGIIGGKRLSQNGPLGRGTAYVQVEHQKNVIYGRCSAALVGNNMILTAAHCFDDVPKDALASRTLILFGNDIDKSCRNLVTVRSVEAVSVHPGWSGLPGGGNDLALVRIEGSAPNWALPLPVLNTPPRNLANQDSYLAGYGKVRDIEVKETDVSPLKFATVRAFQPNEGVDYGPGYLEFDTSKGEAMCQGDSGGPATTKDNGIVKLIGIASFVSFPKAKPTCQLMAVYTSVAHYQSWLQKTYEKMASALSSPNPFALPSFSDPMVISGLE